jgi:hypothetical protein
VIARIWHGYTKPEHADTHEAMLKPGGRSGTSFARRSPFYFTYHTLTGRIFLRFSNGIVVRLTADKTPSPRCVLTGKMFRATTWSL